MAAGVLKADDGKSVSDLVLDLDAKLARSAVYALWPALLFHVSLVSGEVC
jgi:hypothetical protein